jgi:hypothetical protein
MCVDGLEAERLGELEALPSETRPSSLAMSSSKRITHKRLIRIYREERLSVHSGIRHLGTRPRCWCYQCPNDGSVPLWNSYPMGDTFKFLPR